VTSGTGKVWHPPCASPGRFTHPFARQAFRDAATPLALRHGAARRNFLRARPGSEPLATSLMPPLLLIEGLHRIANSRRGRRSS
jgi:hypothetical protein